MSRFWRPAGKKTLYNEDMHTAPVRTQALNEAELRISLQSAVANDHSGIVLKRLIQAALPGIDVSRLPTEALDELKLIATSADKVTTPVVRTESLVDNSRSASSSAQDDLEFCDDDAKYTHALQKTLAGIRKWAATHGVTVERQPGSGGTYSVPSEATDHDYGHAGPEQEGSESHDDGPLTFLDKPTTDNFSSTDCEEPDVFAEQELVADVDDEI